MVNQMAYDALLDLAACIASDGPSASSAYKATLLLPVLHKL